MTLIRFCLILCSLIFLHSSQSYCEDIKNSTFNATYHQLDNGMNIVTIPNRRSPIVVHMVWYHIGAGDDPIGKSGLSHLLEHLMFKGTNNFPDDTFSRLVALNGGRENAFTSSDYTGYFQRISKQYLPLVMELEADRMRNLSLTEDDVLLERDIVLEERSSRVSNVPSSILMEQMYRALFLRHPYGTPVIGWENEIKELNLHDVLTFYNKYYFPNNATLVVAGDIDVEDVLTLAKQHYGSIQPSEIEERIRLKEPKHVSPRRVLFKSPQLAQPSIFRFYLAPSYVSEDRSYSFPLEVFSEVLGGKITSILYQEMVVKRKLATWAGTSYNPMSLDNTTFAIYLSLKEKVSISEAEIALDEIIAESLKDGFEDSRIKAAKGRMAANLLYSLDNPSGVAKIFGSALSIGMSVNDVENWSKKIDSVTADEIMNAANYVLNADKSVTGILIPEKENYNAIKNN
ncbi:MAG: peptidase M16 [Rhodospirillaceae bacterium]|nr:peptidase M16 [Alphaproteobacteria bacterium]MBR72978.1 peptidase M16 [Rhodospirillaceae bacterium]|tara:strand:+ start:1483 stop:2856 length:1374 start_codon:yes stop_codon:yes gene_type:complete